MDPRLQYAHPRALRRKDADLVTGTARDGAGVPRRVPPSLKQFNDGKINAGDYHKQVKNLNDAYKGASELSGKLRKNVEGSFTSAALSRVTGYLGAFASISSAMAFVSSEIRSLTELGERAGGTQVSVSAARAGVIRNLPGATPAEVRQVLSENQHIAGQTGVSEAFISQARAGPVSQWHQPTSLAGRGAHCRTVLA